MEKMLKYSTRALVDSFVPLISSSRFRMYAKSCTIASLRSSRRLSSTSSGLSLEVSARPTARVTRREETIHGPRRDDEVQLFEQACNVKVQERPKRQERTKGFTLTYLHSSWLPRRVSFSVILRARVRESFEGVGRGKQNISRTRRSRPS